MELLSLIVEYIPFMQPHGAKEKMWNSIAKKLQIHGGVDGFAYIMQVFFLL